MRRGFEGALSALDGAPLTPALLRDESLACRAWLAAELEAIKAGPSTMP